MDVTALASLAGGGEMILILALLVILAGAKRLGDSARGSGLWLVGVGEAKEGEDNEVVECGDAANGSQRTSRSFLVAVAILLVGFCILLALCERYE